jgi:hypothetical protein
MRVIGFDITEPSPRRWLGTMESLTGWEAPTCAVIFSRLSKEDVVVVEATGNAAAVAAVIAPHVKRVVIANPKQVRIITHAKIKT